MTRRSVAGTLGLAGWSAAATLTAIVFVCLAASPAGAKIVFDKATGLKLSILPSPALLARERGAAVRSPGTAGVPTCSTKADPTCATKLAYHGGAVQHAENDYLFFWYPNGFASSAPGYEAGLQTWLNDVAAADYTSGTSGSFQGNPISVTQQYYDLSGPGKTKRFVPYDVTNAGTIVDTNSFPTSGCKDPVPFAHCLTQQQLYKQLSTYIAAHHLPIGVNTEYFILTPPGVGGCSDSHNTDCFVKQYCAWHSVGGNSNGLIIYAFQPYLYHTGCDVNQHVGNPNIYTSGIDATVGTFSHELSESMTDPTLNGWYSGNNFDEIGDKCAYQYDVGQPYLTFTDLSNVGGAFYNTVLGSDDYLLQLEFDNSANGGQGGCNQSDTATPPSATLSVPGSAVVTGLPATFSVGNYSGVGTAPAYVTWHFGDGTTATSVGSAPINHYYQSTSGSPFSVSAVVTDTHGNEAVENAASTVTVVAPQPSDIQTAVNAAVAQAPSGAAAKIGAILTNGGYTVSFSALTAGTFNMAWKHGATVVATVTKKLSILGPNRLKLVLTPAGRTLLSHTATKLSNVTAGDSFQTFTATSPGPFTLVR